MAHAEDHWRWPHWRGVRPVITSRGARLDSCSFQGHVHML